MLDENDPEFKSTIDFARKMFVKVCDEREQAKAETQAMEDRAITAINRVSACAVESSNIAMENRRLAERATKIAEKLADQRDALAQELQERDDFSEATSFKLLMRLCGLSQKETAEFLGVSVESIKAWSGHGSRGSRTKPGARKRLVELYRRLETRGKKAAKRINRKSVTEGRTVFDIMVAETDDEARAHGFPCVGACATAAAIAIVNLAPGVKAFITNSRRWAKKTAHEADQARSIARYHKAEAAFRADPKNAKIVAAYDKQEAEWEVHLKWRRDPANRKAVKATTPSGRAGSRTKSASASIITLTCRPCQMRIGPRGKHTRLFAMPSAAI